jgi:5-methylcytosine-specific restriction endonuclease McrA
MFWLRRNTFVGSYLFFRAASRLYSLRKLVGYIAQRQGWKCPACGDDIPSLNERAHHVDHIVPWSLEGGNEISNIQVLHVTCNLSKGQRCDLDNLIRYLQGRLFNIG